MLAVYCSWRANLFRKQLLFTEAWVRFPHTAFYPDVAQLVEFPSDTRAVSGSNPLIRIFLFLFYKKLCEKPTPLGVEWIAQNKKCM